MELELKPPFDLQAGPVRGFPEVLARAGKSPIPQDRLEELEIKIKERLADFKSATSMLQRRLRVLNDTLEGVVQEVDFPFANASNIDVKMAVGTARTLRATMLRAMFSDPKRSFIATSENSGPEDVENSNQLEAAFNWMAIHANNLVESLKDSLIPVYRDGTAFLVGRWRRRIEKIIDHKIYRNAEEFMADYPGADVAGLDEEAYSKLLVEMGSPDAGFLDVAYETDSVLMSEAEFEIVPLARFMWWPLGIKDLHDAEIYGARTLETEAMIRAKAKRGEYWQSVAGEIASAAYRTSSDDWETTRDYIEGISRSPDITGRRFENYLLAVCMDLDGDDIPEKYIGVFNADRNRFLNLRRYHIRKNIDFAIPLRFDRREGRLLGRSLLYDGHDIFIEINGLHRHRNNVRMITDSPSFVVDEALKERVDLGSAEFEWRPGLVAYVPRTSLDGIRQILVSNLSNTANSLDEESSLVRYVEFVIGPTQGLSGQESKGDERSPATKHLSKLRQANFRIDDYIDEFKRSFSAIGNLAMALYYQYADDRLPFMVGEKRDEIDRSLFSADRITWSLNANSVSMSPEFEMEKIMALRQEAAQNPAVVQGNVHIFAALWDRFVAASRTANPDELKIGRGLPTEPAEPLAAPAAALPTPATNGGTGRPGVADLISMLGAIPLGGGAR